MGQSRCPDPSGGSAGPGNAAAAAADDDDDDDAFRSSEQCVRSFPNFAPWFWAFLQHLSQAAGCAASAGSAAAAAPS